MAVSSEALALSRQLFEDRTARRAQLGGDRDHSDDACAEDSFTEQVTDILCEVGALTTVSICRLERRHGNALVKVNAYEIDEDERRLDLVVTRFQGTAEPEPVPRAEVERLARSALRFVAFSRRDLARQACDEGPVRDMVQRVGEAMFDTVRLTLVTDGVARELEDQRGLRAAAGSLGIELHVWDIERLARSIASGRARELIEVDLERNPGGPVPCLPVESEGRQRSYLAALPGALLARLYDDFGERLLELNVRSFLQARGKVNKGIRETLLREPGRFFAYNNGLTAVAQDARVTRREDGTTALAWLRGLQIVNGGQTTASIHRAAKRDMADLSRVFVPVKLTIVDGENVDLIVPRISQCANSQNKVNDADFSANHPFHLNLEQLSRTTWAPGEKTRWFYERARGQYQVARARAAVTPAARKQFDLMHPPTQVFSKTDVAVFEHCWSCLPHVVSRGAQKNFQEFMIRRSSMPATVDGHSFRILVARGIIFRAVRHAAAAARIGAYRANIVAYTVALLSHRLGDRIDLERVWAVQRMSSSLEDAVRATFPAVERAIIRGAGSRNVTEWCKSRDCWDIVKNLEIELPDEPIPEFTSPRSRATP
ncbi:AIPR family protein [Sorangium sp. So ce128]|uniref:AIPR family protein n=1 Tax=Sorangium sp. So ce128 TaxID=3133281 RepID=UPI003F63AB9C